MRAGCGTGLPGVCPCGGLSTAKIVQVGGWGKSFCRCRGRCLSVREFIFGKDNENRVQTKPVRSRRSAFCRRTEAPRVPADRMACGILWHITC